MIGGTWQNTASDRTAVVPATQRIAALMVVLPVFLQAPWVRLHPFSAVLFTVVLLAIGIPLQHGRQGRRADIGALLVGFSGSWLAGCLFWGWLRAHPLLHLPRLPVRASHAEVPPQLLPPLPTPGLAARARWRRLSAVPRGN